ncbi:MAG TPA: ASKHA domain-containing protein, partial [Methanomassiliicoccales archaeon]|nr:ASKHA domain-containing protein [Methanomassiliicoccales archaeon]
QISFAKAAMHAAVEILMERVGIVDEDVSQVLLAGAFGNYASPASGMTIGLFPEVPLERVKGVGNAAGAGATMSLLDSRLRQEAEELAKKVEYVELAAMPEFEDKFHSSLYFPHLDESKYPKAIATIRRR